jgi:hypothetical protein
VATSLLADLAAGLKFQCRKQGSRSMALVVIRTLLQLP